MVSLYLENRVEFVYGSKSCLCVMYMWFVPKINVLNSLKLVPREFLSFDKAERFLPLLVRALFFNGPSRKSA